MDQRPPVPSESSPYRRISGSEFVRHLDGWVAARSNDEAHEHMQVFYDRFAPVRPVVDHLLVRAHQVISVDVAVHAAAGELQIASASAALWVTERLEDLPDDDAMLAEFDGQMQAKISIMLSTAAKDAVNGELATIGQLLAGGSVLDELDADYWSPLSIAFVLLGDGSTQTAVHSGWTQPVALHRSEVIAAAHRYTEADFRVLLERQARALTVFRHEKPRDRYRWMIKKPTRLNERVAARPGVGCRRPPPPSSGHRCRCRRTASVVQPARCSPTST